MTVRPLQRALFAAGLLAAVTVAAMVLGGGDDTVTGVVVSDEGAPLAGAVVRIQGTGVATTTADDGSFELAASETVRVSAWAPDRYIGGGVEAEPGDRIEIELHSIPAGDNPGYEWFSVSSGGEGEGQGCAACHRSGSEVPGDTLPVDQWERDAHGRSAANPRFLTMYAGTDVAGNQSPQTRYVSSRDYGRIPLRPEAAVPYFGPGYRLDFPDSAGNCGACHLPVAAADDPYGVDPVAVAGVAAEGIACDFCHKVEDVRVEPGGLPDPGMPGVLSIGLRRPPEGHQFFAGPFDDVAPGEDAYSPLQAESRYCAPCHFGVFWETVVYDSYGEWLRSPFSDPETGQTCQDCHMPPTGATRFATEAAGGLERDPESLHSHLMPGAADDDLLQDAVTLTAHADRGSGQITVEVTITNDRTGHHVPTDSPLRHLILLVDTRGPNAVPLDLLDGPVVPEWGGVGEPSAGYYAGLPGTAYAKILEELWTEVSPTGAYWNPTRLISDNRIPAMGSDTTRYAFAAPDGPVTIEVTLLFRRAFIELMEQKGWDVPDITMEEVRLDLD